MPLKGSDLLNAAQESIRAIESALINQVIASEVKSSPEGRKPRSIRWILEGPEVMGQIVLWEDGQAELDLADMSTGDVKTEHRNIEDQKGLEGALIAVRDWVDRKTPD